MSTSETTKICTIIGYNLNSMKVNFVFHAVFSQLASTDDHEVGGLIPDYFFWDGENQELNCFVSIEEKHHYKKYMVSGKSHITV